MAQPPQFISVIILKQMENEYSNYCGTQPFFYTLIPLSHFGSPKICNVFHIVNNLEDTSPPQPSTPALSLNGSTSLPQRPVQAESNLLAQQLEQKQLKRRWNSEKENRRKEKQQYRPYQRKGRKKRNFLKENRNVLPIKIRQMLSFLTWERRSQEVMEKCLQRMGWKASFNEKNFFAFLRMKKERVGNYVTLPVLKQFLGVQPEKAELYSLSDQHIYLQLVRVLMGYYLRNLSPLCSLTSNRIRSQQKREHVRVQRDLLKFLGTPNAY